MSLHLEANFCYRKKYRVSCRISCEIQSKLTLGNLSASRDWGLQEIMLRMWLIRNTLIRDDCLRIGESHTVEEFLKLSLVK